jgi:hypothetical protein
VTEGRGDDLRKRGTQRAWSICGTADIDPQVRLIGGGEVTQLVMHSTLLRRQQQQQKTQCFEHVSHSVNYGLGIRCKQEK